MKFILMLFSFIIIALIYKVYVLSNSKARKRVAALKRRRYKRSRKIKNIEPGKLTIRCAIMGHDWKAVCYKGKMYRMVCKRCGAIKL